MSQQINTAASETEKVAVPQYLIISILTIFAIGSQYFSNLSYILNQGIIQNGLKLGSNHLLLPSTLSNLGFAFGVPFGPVLARKFGLRRNYLLFIVIFLCGSIISAISSALVILIAGRVIQGFSAGMLILTILPDSLRSFPNAIRNTFLFMVILTNWEGKEGDKVSDHQELGNISANNQGLPVNSLNNGTIIKNEAKPNELVQAGQVLAQTADMNDLYITANIDETDLKNIEVGDSVDIYVDGDSGSIFNGKIEAIGYATNSVFSALPSENSSGSYTKVTQKVPVKISIENPSSKVLPGMNAEVKIAI